MNKRMKKEVESACEYVLPDYMGDIKKILTSKARVVPGGRFIGEGGVEATGMVEYEVIYADSENRLTAVSASSDYSVTFPTSQEGYVGSSADGRVSNLAIRITGPRKMSLRSTVEASVIVTSSASAEVAGDVFDGEHEPQYTSRTVSVENARYGKSVEREYAEEAERIGDVRADEVEIIATGGSVRVNEVRPTDGGVVIKGILVIGAIVRTPEQPPFAIRREIPFEETVEIEGADRDMQFMADGVVTSAVCGVSEDGEESVISVNAIVEFDAYALENESVNVITDAYLKECPTECKYDELEYTTLGACQINEVSVNDKISRESVGCSDVRDLLTLDGEVRSFDITKVQNGAEIKGEIVISGIACEINVDDSITYIPIKTAVPFVANVNYTCQMPENARIECQVSVSSCEGLLDAENIHVACTLKIRSRAESVSRIKHLCECTCTGGEYSETDMPTSSHITVYYPIADDTLFTVAKRFRTTPEKIACDNMLSDTAAATDSCDSLAGVRKLIIR